MTSKKKRLILTVVVLTVVVIVGAGLCFLFCPDDRLPVPVGKPTFEGSSTELKATKIVPTLDAEIDGKNNIIWCASFLAAWKTLEDDVVGEPPTLEGSPQMAQDLNRAPDPRPQIPKRNLYTAAGWNDKGILQKINKDLASKFPGKAPPEFPDITPDSFVAYAYLSVSIKFDTPYFQNSRALVYTDAKGVKTELSSFGIREEDEYAYYEFREQPKVLFVARDERYKPLEFIIDLDRNSSPNQIILAAVSPKDSLAEIVADVEEKINRDVMHGLHDELGPNDALLVPDIMWSISQRFADLEGRKFTNSCMKGQSLDLALQDISFCLDRGGAELSAESKLCCAPIPTYYYFDRPFLIYMKNRDAESPYFVMWVENAELLKKWEGDDSLAK